MRRPEEQEYCCDYCAGNTVEADFPPPDDEDPVQVYALGGQSNCAGSADADLMMENQDHLALLERNTTKSKVWYAGLTQRGKPDSFRVVPLFAGSEGQRFGPEVPIGYRLQELTGKRVLILKYCLGGTSIKEHWDPETDRNKWDHANDDGSSAFLKPYLQNYALSDYDTCAKSQQFLLWSYLLRQTKEALAAGAIKYEMKGLFWRQARSTPPAPSATAPWSCLLRAACTPTRPAR